MSVHRLEWGVRDLRLHRVSATVMAGNDASGQLCERPGFVHEWDGPGAVLETGSSWPSGVLGQSVRPPPSWDRSRVGLQSFVDAPRRAVSVASEASEDTEE